MQIKLITDVIATDSNINYRKEQLGKLCTSMNNHNSVEGGIQISGYVIHTQ